MEDGQILFTMTSRQNPRPVKSSYGLLDVLPLRDSVLVQQIPATSDCHMSAIATNHSSHINDERCRRKIENDIGIWNDRNENVNHDD